MALGTQRTHFLSESDYQFLGNNTSLQKSNFTQHFQKKYGNKQTLEFEVKRDLKARRNAVVYMSPNSTLEKERRITGCLNSKYRVQKRFENRR
ncbi:hypothetical protein AKO1_008100 [Acrasis kona]|uniref:Uncharacterized protein n=1 Tax=Acrasis kona TaxID=1008807 RepID=A0AAW2YPA5_9EUKA